MPSPTIGQQFVELLATYFDLRERLGNSKMRETSSAIMYYQRSVKKAHANLVAFIDSHLMTCVEGR